MKEKIMKTIIIILLLVMLCGCSYNSPVKVKAKVLSVDRNILKGEMIGHFLSSADGKIQSDVIKVGISFEYKKNFILQDIELSHALAAYYSDCDELPITLWTKNDYGNYHCKICLNGWRVGYFKLNK